MLCAIRVRPNGPCIDPEALNWHVTFAIPVNPREAHRRLRPRLLLYTCGHSFVIDLVWYSTERVFLLVNCLLRIVRPVTGPRIRKVYRWSRHGELRKFNVPKSDSPHEYSRSSSLVPPKIQSTNSGHHPITVFVVSHYENNISGWLYTVAFSMSVSKARFTSDTSYAVALACNLREPNFRPSHLVKLR